MIRSVPFGRRTLAFVTLSGLLLFIATASKAQFVPNVTARASSSQVPGYNDEKNVVNNNDLVETPVGSGKYRLLNNSLQWVSGYGAIGGGQRNDDFPLIEFDLKAVTTVNKFRVWNLNASGYTFRGFRDFTVQYSNNAVQWKTVAQRFRLAEAPGNDNYFGQEFTPTYPITARYIRFWCDSNYRWWSDITGLGKVRFIAGGVPTNPPAESGRYPRDSGIVNVKEPPYNAKGDGVTDDTAALQAAITDWYGSLRTIYLPNGTYLVSNTLQFPTGVGYGNSVIQGESRNGTTIRLKNSTFTDPNNPKIVLAMGFNGSNPGGPVSADWFQVYVSDLTIDTGSGNTGAIGLQYYSNNIGSARNITVRSGDKRGVVGFDLGWTDQNGPCLVKNIMVDGFDIGLRAAASVNSQTIEHLTLTNQRVYGLFNNGQCLTVRDFLSTNAVPAVQSNYGFLTLLDATLTGTGLAMTVPAITSGEYLYCRNVVTTGYASAIKSTYGNVGDLTGPNVAEYVSTAPLKLFPSPTRSLGLPVQETPDTQQDPFAAWVNVRDYRLTTETDDTAAFQMAIDSGAATVYVPSGSNLFFPGDVLVRGKVRRIAGMFANLQLLGSARVKVTDGTAPVVVFEDLRLPAIENLSSRTLVVRNAETSVFSTKATGDLYLENIVGDFAFGSHRIWGRQVNAEKEGTKIVNTGGTLWILGLKTERGGTLIETTDGGKSELLGGLCYTTTQGGLAPMFVNTESSVSAIIVEVCYSGDPFQMLVKETRDGEVRYLPRGNGPMRYGFLGGSALSLYAGYKTTSVRVAPLAPKVEENNASVALTWDFLPEALAYTVKRGTAPNGPFTTLASSLLAPGYTDTTVANGSRYYYVVSAAYPGGESENSPASVAFPQTPGAFFTGFYYNENGNGLYFNSLGLIRNDGTINFDWGNGSPGTGVQNDNFTVRWKGYVQAPQDGVYTFYTTTDDGVHLRVNGVLVVNAWRDQAPTEYSGIIQLKAGETVPVEMEAYDNGGGAAAKLEWSGPGVTRQIVMPAANRPTTLAGRVLFAGIVSNAPPLTVTFTLRPDDASGDIVRTVALSANGLFALKNVPAKTYVLHIKPSKNLAVNLPVNATTGAVAGLTAQTPAGDANNDNSVNFDDFQLLADAYFTAVGDVLYDPQADFNGDGEVNFDDFQLLADNYFTDGDA